MSYSILKDRFTIDTKTASGRLDGNLELRNLLTFKEDGTETSVSSIIVPNTYSLSNIPIYYDPNYTGLPTPNVERIYNYNDIPTYAFTANYYESSNLNIVYQLYNNSSTIEYRFPLAYNEVYLSLLPNRSINIMYNYTITNTSNLTYNYTKVLIPSTPTKQFFIHNLYYAASDSNLIYNYNEIINNEKFLVDTSVLKCEMSNLTKYFKLTNTGIYNITDFTYISPSNISIIGYYKEEERDIGLAYKVNEDVDYINIETNILPKTNYQFNYFVVNIDILTNKLNWSRGIIGIINNDYIGLNAKIIKTSDNRQIFTTYIRTENQEVIIRRYNSNLDFTNEAFIQGNNLNATNRQLILVSFTETGIFDRTTSIIPFATNFSFFDTNNLLVPIIYPFYEIISHNNNEISIYFKNNVTTSYRLLNPDNSFITATNISNILIRYNNLLRIKWYANISSLKENSITSIKSINETDTLIETINSSSSNISLLNADNSTYTTIPRDLSYLSLNTYIIYDSDGNIKNTAYTRIDTINNIYSLGTVSDNSFVTFFNNTTASRYLYIDSFANSYTVIPRLSSFNKQFYNYNRTDAFKIFQISSIIDKVILDTKELIVTGNTLEVGNVLIQTSNNNTVLLPNEGIYLGTKKLVYDDNQNRLTFNNYGLLESKPSLNTTPENTVISLTAGRDFSGIINLSDKVRLFGRNNFGKLGESPTIPYFSFPNQLNYNNVKFLGCGGDHITFAASNNDSSFSIVTAGSDLYGQLGTTALFTDKTISTVLTLTGDNVPISLSCGPNHTVIVLKNNSVRVVGDNSFGQIGNTGIGGIRTAFGPIVPSPNVVKVSCGSNHTAFIDVNNHIALLGDGRNGQIGSGIKNIYGFTYITNLQGEAIRDVACGAVHTIALSTSGNVYGFGSNQFGQLGDGTSNIDRFTPVSMSNINSNVIDIACGYYHTAVLLNNGTIMTVGQNTNGQLGLGDNRNRIIPEVVPGINNAIKIACGEKHTMVLLNDYSIRVFGDNTFAQLGNINLTAINNEPLPVLGLDGPTIIPECSGIGTNIPQHALHIYSSNDIDNKYFTSGILLENGGNGETGIAFKNNKTGENLWTIGLNLNSSNLSIGGYNNKANSIPANCAISVTSNLNVGIGTDNPLAKLHIMDDTDKVNIFRVDDSLNDNNPFIITATGDVGIGTTLPTAKLHIIERDTDDCFRVDDSATDSTPFIIRADGNVGIGTNIPRSLLHVAGNSYLPGSIVQVQYVQTATTRYAIATANISAIPELEINFTPKFANSRILLTAMINNNGRHVSTFGFLKNNVVIITNTNNNSTGSISTTYYGSDSQELMYNINITYMDTATSMATINYKAAACASWPDGVRTIYINDRLSNDMRSISSMTIYEIAV